MILYYRACVRWCNEPYAVSETFK